MQQGWVYVLVNSSMPGMAKVGRTIRSPADRVAELSHATGVATPFILAFDHPFTDCCVAEKTVHDELDRRGLRVATNREFFRGPSTDIIRVILEIADLPSRESGTQADASAELLLKAGDNCFYGEGDRLQDTAEAIRLYKLAIARGSLSAYERLGQIYTGCYASRNGEAARRRASDLLKDGIRQGNPYCYTEMAVLFAWERNATSFNKAWDLFFAARGAAAISETDIERTRFEVACCRYVASSLALGLQPGYQNDLTGHVDGLVRLLLAELDQVRQDEQSRGHIVACLRWIDQSLLPCKPTKQLTCKPVEARRALFFHLPGLHRGTFVPCSDVGRLAAYSGY